MGAWDGRVCSWEQSPAWLLSLAVTLLPHMKDVQDFYEQASYCYTSHYVARFAFLENPLEEKLLQWMSKIQKKPSSPSTGLM